MNDPLGIDDFPAGPSTSLPVPNSSLLQRAILKRCQNLTTAIFLWRSTGVLSSGGS